MKKLYQCLAGGLLATLLSMVPLPSVAQNAREGYISAFTPQEIKILNQEYFIDHPEQYRYGTMPEVLPFISGKWWYKNVLKRGGEGKDRWLLIELLGDSFKNRYLVNTRSLKPGGNWEITSEVWFSSKRVQSIKFVIQVFYNDPGAHHGVAIKHVAMEAVCQKDSWQNEPWVAILGYVNYDSNGEVVSRQLIPKSPLKKAKSRLESAHVERVCYVAEKLPKDSKLLQRGLDRNTLHQPSIYD